MSRSDNCARQDGRPTDAFPAAPSGLIDRSTLLSVSRYDFILTVIPLAFLLGYLGSNVGGLSLEGGMAVAATVGALAVIDALFVHAPTDSGGS